MNSKDVHRLSLQEARRRILAHQGLNRESNLGAAVGSTGTSVPDTLKALGYVQIDTISVIERAHHHVFWSRNPAYQTAHLGEALARGEGFEYWSHAAAFLPVEAYRLSLWDKERRRAKRGALTATERRERARVLARITAEGPLRSSDFAAPPGSVRGTWWDWKPAKRALEGLFMEGELMVRERRGFQKVYDLRSRVEPGLQNLPKNATSMPSDREAACALIRSVVGAHAIASLREIFYLRPSLMKAAPGALSELVESGELVRVELEGIPGERYLRCTDLERRVGESRGVYVLSPFDNLVIQRARLEALFGFRYQIECYVPEPKRMHGYFVLPLLLDGRFVGRLDAKAYRAHGRFVVERIFIEAPLRGEDAERIRQAVARFALWQSCPEVEWKHVEPARLRGWFTSARVREARLSSSGRPRKGGPSKARAGAGV